MIDAGPTTLFKPVCWYTFPLSWLDRFVYKSRAHRALSRAFDLRKKLRRA